MSANQTSLIKQQLLRTVRFFDKFAPLASCHLVEYFTKDLYKNCLDEGLRLAVEDMGYDSAIDFLLADDLNSKPITSDFAEFTSTCKSFYLYNNLELCLGVKELQDQLGEISGLKLNVFMKPKKSHEVQVVSALAAIVHKTSSTTHLVDIGDGKGYLSSMLALHHKVPVLGVDSSLVNTAGAVKRAQKLRKVWRGISEENGRRSVLKKCEETDEISADLYKQITRYVDENVDLKSLVESVFVTKTDRIGITGLHTCGSLGSTSLRLFCQYKYLKSICNISCCYHLLEEPRDFPMSAFLRANNAQLGRSARMLSAQSMDRIVAEKRAPNETIFYRSVLQVVLNDNCPCPEFADRNVGKIRNCRSFREYYAEACRKLKLPLDLSEDYVDSVLESCGRRRKEMSAFSLLRYMLAPVIESLILLDRLLYLHEQGVENAFLVKLFDPVISPRCYGIVAFK